ncbi:acylphosphatase [Emcibacter nanhaiensis]|uniref:acylphosphatase n=1 Tax=Emcibacter nanhaiensis TaxID=1505037 RepID=A0A501PLH9_9PROT|nr:acylphosphatase [Emcibacter nanhaiensis]TPD60616.1 acylphosphatase [Emcibacter nanhaiensis]
MLEPGHIARRLIIHGRVQGVWYRAWTVENASELGLDGWVRNRADGTVEALLVGSEMNVREMIKRCFRGPDRARVKEIEEFPAKGITASGFTQKPTVNPEERRD